MGDSPKSGSAATSVVLSWGQCSPGQMLRAARPPLVQVGAGPGEACHHLYPVAWNNFNCPQTVGIHNLWVPRAGTCTETSVFPASLTKNWFPRSKGGIKSRFFLLRFKALPREYTQQAVTKLAIVSPTPGEWALALDKVKGSSPPAVQAHEQMGWARFWQPRQPLCQLVSAGEKECRDWVFVLPPQTVLERGPGLSLLRDSLGIVLGLYQQWPGSLESDSQAQVTPRSFRSSAKSQPYFYNSISAKVQTVSLLASWPVFNSMPTGTG